MTRFFFFYASCKIKMIRANWIRFLFSFPFLIPCQRGANWNGKKWVITTRILKPYKRNWTCSKLEKSQACFNKAKFCRCSCYLTNIIRDLFGHASYIICTCVRLGEIHVCLIANIKNMGWSDLELWLNCGKTKEFIVLL